MVNYPHTLEKRNLSLNHGNQFAIPYYEHIIVSTFDKLLRCDSRQALPKLRFTIEFIWVAALPFLIQPKISSF